MKARRIYKYDNGTTCLSYVNTAEMSLITRDTNFSERNVRFVRNAIGKIIIRRIMLDEWIDSDVRTQIPSIKLSFDLNYNKLIRRYKVEESRDKKSCWIVTFCELKKKKKKITYL